MSHRLGSSPLYPPTPHPLRRSSNFLQKPRKILNVRRDSVRAYQSISAVIFLLCHALNMQSRSPIDTQLSCLRRNLNGTERSSDPRPSAKEAASLNAAGVKHTCAQAAMDIYTHSSQAAEGASQLAPRTLAAPPLQLPSKSFLRGKARRRSTRRACLMSETCTRVLQGNIRHVGFCMATRPLTS